jgi:hypothetical protein
MATAAETKPPKTSFAGNNSLIAMLFVLSFRTSPGRVFVVTLWIVWKREQRGKTLRQAESRIDLEAAQLGLPASLL